MPRNRELMRVFKDVFLMTGNNSKKEHKKILAQLHEEMRQAGFYIKTEEDACEHFAIIDQEIVWYGNMNLLAKTKTDDSMMRVQSEKIAAELMELTFGKDALFC